MTSSKVGRFVGLKFNIFVTRSFDFTDIVDALANFDQNKSVYPEASRLYKPSSIVADFSNG